MTASQYYEQVEKAYLAYYGRPADPQGLDYWSFRLANAGGDLSAIINAFGASAESQALYGSTPGTGQITAIYQQLFGHAPDAAGLAFYEQGLVTGQYSLASIALAIYNGASGSDLTELQAKLAYANAFTAFLENSSASQSAYSGNVAPENARIAVQSVTDMTSEAAAIASVANTIANIDNLPVTAVGIGLPTTINAEGTVYVTGTQYTQSVAITGGDYSVITDANYGTGKANSIQSVSLTDTGVAGAYSYVTIQSDALHQLTLDGVKQGVYVESAAGARAESVTVDGLGPGYVSSQGTWLEDNTATQMNFHAVGSDSQMYVQGIALQSIVFNNDVNFSLSEFVVSSALTSVSIEGHGDFSADMESATHARIDASQSSGDITLTLAAGESYTGGSGDSVIDITGGHVLTQITVGQGSVTLGESLAHVSFDGNGNTLTVNGTQASFATDTASSQTSVSTANLDVIKGLHAGDVLTFASQAASATVDQSSNLAGVAGNVEFVHGSFNAGAQTFAVNASGHDTLVTYGTTGDFVSVVLVGVDESHLPAALSNYALTLG